MNTFVSFSEVLFWISLLTVTYTYVLYPCLLFVAYNLSQIRRDFHFITGRVNRRRDPLPSRELPNVSLIIPAYNEEHHLPTKIRNLSQIDYPTDKLEIVFVSDGSSDQTNGILDTFRRPGARVIYLPQRSGKPTALNHGVAQTGNEILIFSDTSTLFSPDAIKKLVRHFSDSTVGVACGALHFRGNDEYQNTEGVYWKYETALRIMEARLGATLTASGAIYAIRRECFPNLEPDVVIEDFVIPMNARKLGYRVVFDPEAVATEFAADSVAGEFTRRVRIAVGSFKALGQFMRIRLDAFTLFAFVSHKVLRWVLPFLLVFMLLSNVVLIDRLTYRVLLAVQLLFYLWAAFGFLFHQRMQKAGYALMGYFLLAIHLAYLVGFARFLTGRSEVKWRRV